MPADMLEAKSLITRIPEPPEEVTLLQAAGLIPLLAEAKTKSSWVDRLRIHDPVVRTWALVKLLKEPNSSVPVHVVQMAMHVAPRSAYLRKNLLPRLIESFRFELVQKLLGIEKEQAPSDARLHAQLVKATHDNDFEQLALIHERLYLLTGDESHLTEALEVARSRLGWKAAVKPFLRNIFTQQQPVQSLGLNWLRSLERENAQAEFNLVGSLLKPLPSSKICTAYVIAQQLFWDKDYAKCVDFLQKSKLLDVAGDKISLFWHLAAAAAEKNGDARQAAEFYQKQNNILKSDRIKPERFIKDLEARARWEIGSLPADPHDNYLIMTGFPRSGTTLLENVLASHPAIETCEETSSLIASVQVAYKSPLKDDPKGENLTLRARLHRQLYYANMARFVHKPDAKVVIDKTPIIGANIKYLEKIFPTKRYIFSIRHPYDVVLSNYKQDYGQNIAMAAFNDIHDACVLYNHVMTDWFDVFPGETDRVHYIKYDDLVNDFEPVIRRALAFIGVEWTDEVTRFAEHSAKRAVRTPSYTNVRKGLTIGVQSSWQQFDFLFDDRCRQLLDPWVRRFGYEAA